MNKDKDPADQDQVNAVVLETLAYLTKRDVLLSDLVSAIQNVLVENSSKISFLEKRVSFLEKEVEKLRK